MDINNAVDTMLRDLFFESWMNEEDYKYLLDETFMVTGISREMLISEISVGVANGYPIGLQVEMVKRALTNKQGG